jgi:xylose isomerase
MLRADLASIAARVEAEGIEPAPRSGRQERLENLVNRFI